MRYGYNASGPCGSASPKHARHAQLRSSSDVTRITVASFASRAMTAENLLPLLGDEERRHDGSAGSEAGINVSKWPVRAALLFMCLAASGLFTIFRGFRPPLRAVPPVTLAEELPKCDMRNLNYLGMAYDMAKGMPQPWQSQLASGEIGDPGWRILPVFEVGQSWDRISEDGQCKLPSGTFMLQDEECSFEHTSWEIATAYEFQKLLSNQFKAEEERGIGFDMTKVGDVKLHGLHIGFGSSAFFSQSAEFREVNTSTQDHRYILTTATCNAYRAVLGMAAAAPKLSDAFRSAVDDLPASLEDGHVQYAEFLKDWGTHFSTHITMGARYSEMIQFDQEAFNHERRQGFNAQKASRQEFLIFRTTTHTSFARVESELEKHFQTSYSRKRVCYGAGGRCPDPGQRDRWRQASMRDPLPLVAEFKSILSLLTDKYFKDPHISNKHKSLAKIMERSYCLGKEGCAVVVPEMYTTEAAQVPDGGAVWSSALIFQGVLYALQTAGWRRIFLQDQLPYVATTSGLTNTLRLYDGRAMAWSEVKLTGSPLPDAVNFAMAASSQRLFLLGGLSCDGESYMGSDQVYEISLAGAGSVDVAGSFGFKAWGLGAVVVHDRLLYAIGGASQHPSFYEPNAKVTAFDTYRRSFEWKPSLEKARVWHAVALHAGIIFVVGGMGHMGHQGWRALNGVLAAECYRTAGGESWIPMPAPQTPRMGAGMAVAAGHLLLFGGFAGRGGHHKSIATVEFLPLTEYKTGSWCYHHQMMKWPKAFVAAAADSSSRDMATIYLLGGQLNVEEYKPSRTVEVWSLPQPHGRKAVPTRTSFWEAAFEIVWRPLCNLFGCGAPSGT